MRFSPTPCASGSASWWSSTGKPITFTPVATNADVTKGLSIIDAYAQGHPNVAGMLAVDAGSTQAVAQTIQKYKAREKGMKGGGYDLLPKTLELLKADQIDFTIDQQAYLQGFYPVLQLFLTKLSGTLTGTGDMNTGLKFLTKDDAPIYLGSPSRFEGSTKEQKVIQPA